MQRYKRQRLTRVHAGSGEIYLINVLAVSISQVKVKGASDTAAVGASLRVPGTNGEVLVRAGVFEASLGKWNAPGSTFNWNVISSVDQCYNKDKRKRKRAWGGSGVLKSLTINV